MSIAFVRRGGAFLREGALCALVCWCVCVCVCAFMRVWRGSAKHSRGKYRRPGKSSDVTPTPSSREETVWHARPVATLSFQKSLVPTVAAAATTRDSPTFSPQPLPVIYESIVTVSYRCPSLSTKRSLLSIFNVYNQEFVQCRSLRSSIKLANGTLLRLHGWWILCIENWSI